MFIATWHPAQRPLREHFDDAAREKNSVTIGRGEGRVCYEAAVRRLALHLTCFFISIALCAVPGVDAREFADAKATVGRHSGEQPQLGLPAPQVQPRAPLPFFAAPGIDVTPLITRAQFALRSVRRDDAPEISWKARAHPAQAPPV
jgi:hypothetical protein